MSCHVHDLWENVIDTYQVYNPTHYQSMTLVHDMLLIIFETRGVGLYLKTLIIF